jgi:APA family basic amino acid/polyamine antiporter
MPDRRWFAYHFKKQKHQQATAIINSMSDRHNPLVPANNPGANNAPAPVRLDRSLGLVTALLIVANLIIGSGAFKKIAPMSAALMDKDYILLAWVLAGIISIFGAFTMAGLASLTTESGGIYEYLRLSFGNLFSFLYGWASFLVIGSAGIAALAFILSESFNELIPLPNPLHQWQHVTVGNYLQPFANGGIKIFAITMILLLSWINFLGTKKGERFNNIVTTAKIAGILLLIVAGLFYTGHVQTENTTPVPSNLNSNSLANGLFTAMLSAFWAYDGWYCVGFMGGEIKHPQKNIPIAIIAGIGISMIIFVLLNAVFIHVIPVQSLASLDENSVAGLEVAKIIGGNTGAGFIAVLLIISILGSLNANIATYPRLYFRMAEEKFFPNRAASIHPRYKTPHIAMLYSMVLSCIMVVSGTFDLLTNIIIVVEFLFFMLLGSALIKMKKEGKITARLIAYPFAPVILIVFSLCLVINSILVQPVQAIAGITCTLSGLPLYFYYKKRNRILSQNTGAAG